MAQIFTITNVAPSFTATVVRNDLAVQSSTSTLSVSKINPAFTATLYNTILSVDSTDSTVVIEPVIIQAFTGTIVEQTISIVEQTIAEVIITPTETPISIANTSTAISITYNPTIVEHIFDGQPVYTTSSVQFATLTLGTTSTFRFPLTDGVTGQTLLTNGSGQLYWGSGGGGGGQGEWSLNSDLITNGFKIRSGTDTVDLTLIGGGTRIQLENTGTYIGTSTGYLRITANTGTQYTGRQIDLVIPGAGLTTTARELNLGNYSGALQIGQGHVNIFNEDTKGGFYYQRGGYDAHSIEDGDYLKLQLTTGTDVTLNKDNIGLRAFNTITFTATSIVFDSELSPVNVLHDLNATRIFSNELRSLGATLKVPSIEFPDGTVQYSANTSTITAYTTGTIVLRGDIITNGNVIKDSNGSGVLTLVQGDSRIELTGAGLSDYQDSISLQTYNGNELFMNGQVFNVVHNGDIGLRASSDMRFTATTLLLNIGEPVEFTSGIRFPDGTLQTSAAVTTVTNVISTVTIAASTGISVAPQLNGVTITNTGVRKSIAGSGIIVTKTPFEKTYQSPSEYYPNPTSVPETDYDTTSTGDLYVSIGNLPIIGGYAIDVNQEWFGETALSVNSATLAQNIIAGQGINVTRNGGQVTVSANTVTVYNQLTNDLLTKGYKIDGESNALTIEAGKFSFLGNTLTSKISMPFNSAMQITSDFGITIDTPDSKPVQILSPLTILHRDGSSRISTDALGLTRLNDTIIAMTATNKVVINESTFDTTRLVLRVNTSSGSISIGQQEIAITATTTATVSAQDIRLASTGTTRVGSDIYHSKLAVQDITNWNKTGPVTVSKGIQFADTSVQTTAYQGYLNFGQIAQPARNLEEFVLQFQTVDFGTIANPGTLSYDGGVIA